VSVDHYENFPVASLLLPGALREPVEVIYRFARSADDFADEGDDAPATRLEKLGAYKAQLALIALGGKPDEGLFTDIARIVQQHGHFLPVPALEEGPDERSENLGRVVPAGDAILVIGDADETRVLQRVDVTERDVG